MNQKPNNTFQQRMIDEKNELEIKAKALSAFIDTNPLFDDLDVVNQKLMREQRELMWSYWGVLGTRIALQS